MIPINDYSIHAVRNGHISLQIFRHIHHGSSYDTIFRVTIFWNLSSDNGNKLL